MKKYLRYGDVLVLFAGAAGLLLRLFLIMGGTDERGLYPKFAPAWILLCLLSLAVVAAVYLLTKQAGDDTRYEINYPASVVGAVGNALAAVGMFITAIAMPNGEMLNLLCCITGVAAAVALLGAAAFRFTGKKPHFLCHAAPAVFFALRLFLLGKDLGAEPELSRFLFEMLASLALVPACYQLWGFDVDLGHRSKSLFWMLTAAYLCIVAIVGMENWLLYLACAVWLLTNLCPLKFLVKPEEDELQVPAGAENAAEVPQAEEISLDAPAEVQQESVADPLEDFDPDKILAEILREIDRTVE